MKGRLLSVILALSMALSLVTPVSAAGDSASADVYTYGSTDGAKDESEIFDSVNMVDWTKSRIDGDTDNPMFEAYSQSIDGESVWTLKRQRDSKNKNNADGYVTYKADGMTSFKVVFIIGMNQGYAPADAKFYTSSDNSSFVQVSDIVKDGTAPEADGEFVRYTYTGYNIPTGDSYLRIAFPGLPDASDAGFKTVQLEKVTISKNAAIDGWDGEKVELSYPSSTLAHVEWNPIDYDGDYSYMISRDGLYVNTVSKSKTSCDVPVEASTEYRFQVAAVSESGNVLKTSKLISSDILKTEGKETVFVDRFKFAETITNGKTWSGGTPSWNAENKSVQRTTQTDSLEVVYEIPNGINGFEVTMIAYNPKALPGETTFEVRTADGWQAVTTTKTDEKGSPTWRFFPWVYTAAQVPQGADALKIVYGKASSGNNRQNSLQLQKVVVYTNAAAKAYAWESDELSYTAKDNEIELSWPAISGNPDDIKYIITKDSQNVEVTDSAVHSYKFKDLTPGTEYKFTVTAQNKTDDSKKSDTLEKTATTYKQENLWGWAKASFTDGSKESEKILNIPAISGAKSVTYTVWNSAGDVIADAITDNTLTIENLTAGTHDFTIQAVAAFADGVHYSTKLSASVTIGDVERWDSDASISVYNVKKNGFSLSWTAFSDMEGRKYIVRVNGTKVGETEEESFEVTDLKPGTEYNISIIAAEGASEVSDALTKTVSTTRDRDFYIDFLGSDLSNEDWTKNTYYHSAEEIPMIVALNDAVFSLTQHANDPQGPNWGAFFRIQDGSSPDSYVAVDAGAPLSEFVVKNLVSGAQADIKIEYAEDDGEPQATLGNFDVDEHTWISLEGSYSAVQVGTAGEWDDSKKVRKSDRQVYEHRVSKLPQNARYFRIFFSKITAETSGKLRPWRSGTLGFGGTYTDELTDAAYAYDIASALAAGDSVDSVTKNLSLPDEVDGYPVTWKSSREEIIGADGTFNSDNIKTGYKIDNIILTAEFRRNKLDTEPEGTRTFKLCAVKNTDGWTDEDFINFDLTLFADSAAVVAPHNPQKIWTTIMLPQVTEGGCDFTWSVSDANHAKVTEDGTIEVTLENDSETEFDIILSAKRGSLTKTRKYPVKLIRGWGDNIALGSSTLGASSNKSSAALAATKNPETYWENDASDLDAYLQYTFNDKTSFMAVLLAGDNIASYKISVSSDGKAFTEAASGGEISDFEAKLIPCEAESVKYVRVNFAAKDGASVKVSNFEVYNTPATNDQVFEMLWSGISIPKRASSNITLPEKGYKDIPITWSSSNTSAVSNSGKVTQSSSAVSVTLTAEATYGGETRKKTFTTTVPAKSGSSGGGYGGGSSSSSGGGVYIPNNNEQTAPPDNNQSSGLYSDVSASHWAYEYIKALSDKKVISGIGDGKFGPEEKVSREAFVKMVLGVMGSEIKSEELPFDDTVTGAWYYPYVSTAYKLGIVSGIDETTFGVGNSIKRCDMAVMAMNILKAKNIDAAGDNADYADRETIPEYAREAAGKLAALSVMKGDDEGRFNPLANATRAEAARIVYALSELLK